MTNLDLPIKERVMNSSMGALIDEFFCTHHRWPELGELSTFVDSIAANHGAILKIIDERNRLPFLLSSQIGRYPEFWEDLWHNVQLEKIPRSIRPNRRISGDK